MLVAATMPAVAVSGVVHGALVPEQMAGMFKGNQQWLWL
jgi:hypothetical protein